MKATYNGVVIAEADKKDTVLIEGGIYFPPDSLKKEFFKDSDGRETVCFWKGKASYYDVVAGGKISEMAAWYYAEPKDGSIDRVGKDFTKFVSFYPVVTISE
ncbi:DUF427 domain-containing protein [Candidatus Saccharibacteria bacterium]|nr:DUF427 domain-containing protein [Candidatus Saccharibacteria bacterium]